MKPVNIHPSTAQDLEFHRRPTVKIIRPFRPSADGGRKASFEDHYSYGGLNWLTRGAREIVHRILVSSTSFF